MGITQVFTSADDEKVIGEIEIGADNAAAIPIVGDNIKWVLKDKVYAGRVKSRLISYSAPDHIAVGTAHEVDIRAVLSVELTK